jgi:hypothetical protein
MVVESDIVTKTVGSHKHFCSRLLFIGVYYRFGLFEKGASYTPLWREKSFFDRVALQREA